MQIKMDCYHIDNTNIIEMYNTRNKNEFIKFSKDDVKKWQLKDNEWEIIQQQKSKCV